MFSSNKFISENAMFHSPSLFHVELKITKAEHKVNKNGANKLCMIWFEWSSAKWNGDSISETQLQIGK